MSNQKKIVPCDCLNWCGDDPWLKKGKSEPCARAKFRAEQAAKMDDFCNRFEAARKALREKLKGGNHANYGNVRQAKKKA